jgi:uncharacterized membrane protein YvbJ
MVNDFKFCFECGTKIKQESKFCESCGTKQITQQETIANENQEPQSNQKEHQITINVQKFKEILIHSWNLLSLDKQAELATIGIKPEKCNR